MTKLIVSEGYPYFDSKKQEWIHGIKVGDTYYVSQELYDTIKGVIPEKL